MKLLTFFTPPQNEDELFKVLKKELVFLGCYIKDPDRFSGYLWGIFMVIALGVSVVGEFALAFQELGKRNLPLVFEVLCPATTMGVTNFKLVILLWKQKELKSIFETFRVKFTEEIAEKGVEFRKRFPTEGYYLAIFLTITTCCTGTSFDIIPIVSNITAKLRGETPNPQLPFKSIWPWPTHSTPSYEIMYVYLWFAGIITQIGIPAADALVMDFYFHASFMFNTVSYDLAHLVPVEDRIAKFTHAQNRRLGTEITRLMRKHNSCFEVAERIRVLISEILFVHFLSAAFIICLSSIDLMLAPGLAKLIFINYIIAATCQVFIYALAGSHLEDACVGIATAAYDLPLHRMDGRNRVLLKMMIMRAQKPALIKVPFVTASLPTFSSICQAAGSYVTLLKTFL